MRRPAMTAMRSAILLALAALLLIPAASAQAKAHRGFVGMVDDVLLDGSANMRGRDLRGMAHARVGTLREQFDWARIERSPGVYDFADYDAFMASAAAYRIRVLPVLFNPPDFASRRPRRHAHRGVYPPKRNADMARFAAAMVRRYGPDGAFWKEHPGLPAVPVHAWQVWNEPNIPVYWRGGVNARAYTKLLRTVGAAIKKENPGAEVITAGIPNSNTGQPFAKFVRGIYRAGGRSAFDALSIHPYARNYRGTVAGVRYARRLMNRHGDRAGRIWVTELGWSSSGPRSAFRVGRRGQARQVSAALRALARRRRSLRLDGVIYYKWRDTRRTRRQHDFFGLHTGLNSWRAHPKPALARFRRAARAVTR